MKRSQLASLLSQKWRISLLLVTIFSLLLIFSITFIHRKPSPYQDHQTSTTSTEHFLLPRFAYLISGTRGETKQVKRLLQSVYHPRNYYIIHLDLDAADEERLELAKYAMSEAAIRHFRNVMVVGKADLITSKGPTVVAATLHAVAILLKRTKGWDWFINLRVGDYPLVSQDGIKEQGLLSLIRACIMRENQVFFGLKKKGLCRLRLSCSVVKFKLNISDVDSDNFSRLFGFGSFCHLYY